MKTNETPISHLIFNTVVKSNQNNKCLFTSSANEILIEILKVLMRKLKPFRKKVKQFY